MQGALAYIEARAGGVKGEWQSFAWLLHVVGAVDQHTRSSRGGDATDAMAGGCSPHQLTPPRWDTGAPRLRIQAGNGAR
jgi:hypothetical protein